MDLRSLLQNKFLFQLIRMKLTGAKTAFQENGTEESLASSNKTELSEITKNGAIPSAEKLNKNGRSETLPKAEENFMNGYKRRNSKQKANRKGNGNIQEREANRKSNGNIQEREAHRKYNGNILERESNRKSNGNIPEHESNRKSNGNIPERDEINNKVSVLKQSDTNKVGELFPKSTPWFVFLFTLAFRLWYVSKKENWWILHPDEVYQTIEVAHSEVYGYGFRTFEYLPADIPGYHITAARAQKLGLGMYSLRSFMLPHLIAFFMFIVDRAGVSASPFLVAKAIHVIVSSFLPLTVYRFTKGVYLSHDVASLAAILVSTSFIINVFGTHSLVNSFLSPFVFLSLTAIYTSAHKSSNTIKLLERTANANVQHGVQHSSRDHNSNLPAFSDKNKRHTRSAKVKPNQLIVRMCKIKQGIKEYIVPEDFRFRFDISEYFFGLCLSLCAYTRCDIILLPVCIAIASSKFSGQKLVRLVLFLHNFVLGFITGILIGGLYDRLCYGTWFVSPYQWVKFNVFQAASKVLFGNEPVTFYVENVMFLDLIHVIWAIVMILDLIMSRKFLQCKVTESPYKDDYRFSSLYVFLMLTLTYSLSAHKELRFFHNGLVFMYIHCSVAVVRLLRIIVQLANQNYSQYYSWFYLFIGFLASSQMLSFLQMQDRAISRWTYMRNGVSYQTNTCLDFISKQNDVTGVFLDQPLYMTGGYTVLHKDVPIFALNTYEFFEFDSKSRFKSLNIANQNISLSDFERISNFVSIYNTYYLWKQLILKPEYNYLVLKSDRKFTEKGYNEVFRSGNSKVMKRQMTKEIEAEVSKLASEVPLGYNATILEYESFWLIKYGVYKLAEDKLLFANRLDQSRIGPYQLLIGLFRGFGQETLVKNVLDACTALHKKAECLGIYSPIQLHDSYFRDLHL